MGDQGVLRHICVCPVNTGLLLHNQPPVRVWPDRPVVGASCEGTWGFVSPHSTSISVSPKSWVESEGKVGMQARLSIFTSTTIIAYKTPNQQYFVGFLGGGLFLLFSPPFPSLLLSPTPCTFPSLPWSVDVVVMVIVYTGWRQMT